MSIRHIEVTFPVFAVSRVMKTHLVTTGSVCMFHHQSHPECFYVQVPLKERLGSLLIRMALNALLITLNMLSIFFPLNPGLQIYAII